MAIPDRERAYLLDIQDAIGLIQRYMAGVTREMFDSDVQLQDAVFRRLTVIGEAARRIPRTLHDQYPDIPWAQMIGFRNVVVHEYDDVDLEVVWNVARTELAALGERVEQVLNG